MKGALFQLPLLFLWPSAVPGLYCELLLPVTKGFLYLYLYLNFAGLYKARGWILLNRLASERRPRLVQSDLSFITNYDYNQNHYFDIIENCSSVEKSFFPAESREHQLFLPIERLRHWSRHNIGWDIKILDGTILIKLLAGTILFKYLVWLFCHNIG